MVSALTNRTLLGVLLFACAGIVLGISAYATHNNRIAGVYSDILSLVLAVACLTIAYEGLWTPGRHLADSGPSLALIVEAIITFILWALWLAAAAAYTAESRAGLTICNNRGSFPAFTRGEISTACNTLRTLIAFLWITFVINTVIFGYTVYVALTKPTGARSNWAATFMQVSERGVVFGTDGERHGRPSDATFVEPSGTIQPKQGRSAPRQEPSGTMVPAEEPVRMRGTSAA